MQKKEKESWKYLIFRLCSEKKDIENYNENKFKNIF